jgi:hypothetical protein
VKANFDRFITTEASILLQNKEVSLEKFLKVNSRKLWLKLLVNKLEQNQPVSYQKHRIQLVAHVNGTSRA